MFLLYGLPRVTAEVRVSQGTRQRGRGGYKTREETEVRLQEKTFYLPETESDRIQEALTFN
jgi:hypothetical protein